MKKKTINLIINGLTACLCIVLFAYLSVNLLTGYISQAVKVILSVVIGIFVTLALNSIVHELGHVLSGLLCGLKVNSVQFYFLYIGKDKGRFSVKIKSSGGEIGVTDLAPKTTEKVLEKYVISAIGGLIATLVLLIVQVLICLLSKSLILYAGLGITFPITAYIFLINLFPNFAGNDGYLIYTYLQGGNPKRVCKNYYLATALLYQGVEPSELEPSLLIDYGVESEYSVGIRYLRYLAYLQSDEETAIKELRKISDLSKFSTAHEEVFEELFFSALTIGDDKFVKSYEDYALSIFSKQARPQSFRAHAVYLIKNGEIDWAKLILTSGVEFCETYPIKGVAKAEKRYMEEILKNL